MKILFLAKKKSRFGFTMALSIGLLSGSLAFARPVCLDAQVTQVGTPMTSHEASRMLADATFDENKNLSRQEKIRRVMANMAIHRPPLDDVTDQDLAEQIVDISECTGHDFSIMAGLFRKESTYCLAKLNTSSRKSTASGCGQITIWPIREFKNHLVLPGRRGPSSAAAKESLETLINSCMGNRSDEFIELLSQSENSVKAYLRNESDYEFDVFMSALYLKFLYGLRGFYYNPHTSSAGALSLYGEGSGYARLVNRFASGVQQSSQLCFDDEDYIREIERTSCELSEDSASCSLTTPTWEI